MSARVVVLFALLAACGPTPLGADDDDDDGGDDDVDAGPPPASSAMNLLSSVSPDSSAATWRP